MADETVKEIITVLQEDKRLIRDLKKENEDLKEMNESLRERLADFADQIGETEDNDKENEYSYSYGDGWEPEDPSRIESVNPSNIAEQKTRVRELLDKITE